MVQPWYAVRVKSNFEQVTAHSIQAKGVPAFAPLYTPRKSPQPKQTQVPLFRGYIFCRLDPLNRLPILMVPGVVNIVSLGKTPQPVEESEISAVMKVLDSHLDVAPFPAMPVGQKIRLEQGPLTGAAGVIVEQRGSELFIVSVSLFQRSIAVDVQRSWLTK